VRWKELAALVGTASAGMLVYGTVVESNRLVLERHKLRLPRWPDHLNGFKIAVLSDFHFRGPWSLKLGKRAVALALEQAPDMVLLPGDFVDHWKPGCEEMILDCLAPLALMRGNAVAVPGNHDYDHGQDAGRLAPLLEQCDIKLLRNEIWTHRGVTWIGIDSAVERRARPSVALDASPEPRIAVWHEPDLVEQLPPGCALQVSGHSHGGQFRFPFGITPMHSYLGKRYPRGFYADAPTPLYVSRGIGTTGPPSRFLCPPEVSLLELFAA
jgi:predicted MPP superfamily phosphohydrolase